jgi:hypothetical protein
VIFRECLDFVVTNNRFEHFGKSGVTVVHKDTLARGLIFNNEFVRNLNYNSAKPGFNLGYGVLIGGEDQQWVSDPRFGTDNFIFIEDNYFEEHRHAIAGAGGGLYVFRHNTIKDNVVGQAVDAHGGGDYGNTISTRAYEVYDNYLYTTKFVDGTPHTEPPTDGVCVASTGLAYRAITFRGGEGLFYNNTIENYRHGLTLSSDASGDYPVFTQVGYQSGLEFGPNHSGSFGPEAAGDVFEWNNEFIRFDDSSCIYYFRNFWTSLMEEDRDYHLNTVKPGYAAYIYPHPLRSLYGPEPIPTSTSPTPPIYTIDDLLALLDEWRAFGPGTISNPSSNYDLNSDGTVNAHDFALMVQAML